MDSKEVKVTLKNAREAIRNKEFKDALKHCKVQYTKRGFNIFHVGFGVATLCLAQSRWFHGDGHREFQAVLSVDKNNYMALVLIAVAAEGLEEFDQALKAYKRAAEADAELLLAWQGLSSFYEKHPLPAYRSDHISVYLKLLELNAGEQDKKVEILMKLTTLLDKKSDDEALQQVLKYYRGSIEDEKDVETKLELQWRLVSLLQLSNLQDNNDEIIRNCEAILSEAKPESTYLDSVIDTCLNLLMKKGHTELRVTCESLYKRFPDSLSAMMYWVLCQLDDFMVKQQMLVSEDFVELVERLASLTPKGTDKEGILSTAQGFICLYNNELTKARNFLSSSQSQKPVCMFYLLSLTLMRCHDNMKAVNACDDGLKILQRKDRIVSISASDVMTSLYRNKVISLYRHGSRASLNIALEVLEKELSDEDVDMLILKGKVLVQLGDIEGAKKCIEGDSIGRLTLEGKICVAERDYETAKLKFQEAITRDDGNYENHLNLATSLWVSGKRTQECFHALLKAAKLDPCCSTTFLYLGHYYSTVANDTTRARKCYQKSFDLDLNEEAGAALCDILTAIGEEDEAHGMLIDVTNKASAGSAKWAWLRLGLYQVKHEDPTVAIASFQAALRADPTDNHVWECLAEAYYHRGSYTAALKAFSKASELDPDSMYCLFQMAAIKQTLGVYTEAIEEYKTILEKSPNYVPALKGLGETYLLQARSLMSRCFHGRARDNSQMAVQHLTRAVSFRPDLSCLWKLMGDACTILHILPTDGFRFEVPSRLIKSSESKPDETATLGKIETLQLGGRCYGKALKIFPESSSLWHDLGVNYFHQSQAVLQEDKFPLADKSVQALKKAISLEPTNHKHWTALGHVACHKVFYRPDLAQHCFIKSIQCEANNVVAWTNLAALYLKNGNVQLSHEAFKIAQSLEPSYIPCWIGQAIIAETVGHEDAMDLFRHTTELGNHIEGSLGYGHWVCSLLLDVEKQTSELYQYAIHQMAAIPAASDALAKYIDCVQDNWAAHNMHGLLLERQKLYKSAAQAFEKCLQHAEEKAIETVRTNYARVLCKSGEYDKSVEVYETLTNLENFEDLCQKGLACYKAGKLEESFKAYTKALDIASTETDKSHVYAALAMVQYKFGDLDATKSTLFDGFKLSEPSLWGLEALCALGLLQSDVTLATAVQEELFKHGGADDHMTEIMLLNNVLNMQKDGARQAIWQLQKMLHKNPLQANLWKLLADVLLKHFPHHGRAVTNAANCSLLLDTVQKKEKMKIFTAGHLFGGYHSNRNHNSFSSVQRLIHCYPDDLEHWALLASAVHGEAILTTDTDHRQELFATELYVLRNILSKDDVSLSMKLWCHKQCVVCTIHAGKQNEAFHHLEQLLTEFSEDKDVPVFFEVFKNVLMSDIEGLKVIVQKHSVLYYWQILSDMYIQTGVLQEVEEIMQQYLQSAQGHSESQVQVTGLLKLAHFAFQNIMQDKPSDSLRGIFDECVQKLQLVHTDSTVTNLMQAGLNLQDNKRLSKHHTQRVLRCHMTGSRSYDYSLARRMLIYILHSGKMDEELLQVLLREAEEEGDQETLEYYQRITSAQK